MNEFSWQIKAPAANCQKCSHKFQNQEPYFSVLLKEANDYDRRDYCPTCWPEVDKNIALSRWRGSFRKSIEQAAEPIRKDYAEGLLRELLQEQLPGNRNAIYILALLLERKRVLVEREIISTPPNDIVRIYEHKKSNEIFLIPEPALPEAQKVDKIQKEVTAIFNAKTPTNSPVGQNKQPASPPI